MSEQPQAQRMTHTTRRLLFGFTAALASFCLLALVLIAITGLRVQMARRPGFLGNTSKTIHDLEKTVDPRDFTFIVMGDTRWGTTTFKTLLNIAQKDRPAFVVILGDFVNYPERIRHKLFTTIMDEQDLQFPVFLVPGNHDVSRDGPFRLKDFEEMYGPAQFYFTIGKNLFVFLNNIVHEDNDQDYLQFMEEVLAEHGKDAQDIFVFMHCPPSGLTSWVHGRSPGESEVLFRLAKKFGVRFVITGDHHGYVKTKRDGTTYLITGGGGARLRGENGRFHHFVRMAVQDGQIHETVMATERRPVTLELLRRNIVFHVWPLMSRNSLSAAATLVLFAGMIWALIFSLRHLKRSTFITAQKETGLVRSEGLQVHVGAGHTAGYRWPKESA